MDAKQAVAALGALAQDTRLQVFRMLVEQGPEGLPAGIIAERAGIPSSSLTFHLQQLLQAGLVTQRRVSRQIFYAMVPETMNGLVAYLTEHCCGGATCAPACQPAMPLKAPNSEGLHPDTIKDQAS
ncbi:ArsR/SmtB family transcription factor [Roseomonas xinghualingensis]|uniref:ArsR/SmtB family transcription factor n=1 Tax=Roseomonas xinghualingensis TaxID=2986475 RepID=UPI0021F0C1F8|nr:metalloregulator ArsR/SmtB family transcription factor [Roseomonas sp. SXEYE001]MCV4207268.1 metalloregulator ArsR/SmtB family transcription factor [Roseomonas sp. SXEYE001]